MMTETQSQETGATNETSTEVLDTFETPVQRSPEEAKAELAKMNGQKPGPSKEKKTVTQTEQIDEETVVDEEDGDKKEKEASEDEKKDKDALEENDKVPSDQKQEKEFKAIRAKFNDENIDIPEDATVKVSVKNKSEFVTIKELRDAYSGKQAWGSKIQEASRKEKAAEQFYEKTKAEKQELAGHINKITELLDDTQKDPLDALLYLVDLSGRNVHDYTKRVYDHLSKTVLELEQMDDVEKRLFWRERELNYLKNNSAAKEAEAKKVSAQREYSNRINRLRESQGVSEEHYVQAHQDLVKLGYSKEQITPEAIVKYAVYKPLLDKADEICSSYEEDLTTDEMDQLIDVVAETLKRNPKLDDAKALEIAAYQLGWDVETDEKLLSQAKTRHQLSSSVRPSNEKKTNKKQSSRPESFSDFDDQFYGRA